MNWLDPYEIRARIIPVIIVFSPVLLLMTLTIPNLMSQLSLVLGEATIGLFILYFFSFVVRHYGKKIESVLWDKWDGPPSTRYLRWSDPTFDSLSKKQIHDLISKRYDIALLSRENEIQSPQEADKIINTAFLKVKAELYQNDPEGLWKKHNMEYGFNRNMIGCRIIWLFISIICSILIIGIWYYSGDKIFLCGFIICIVELICSILFGWHYLPILVKESADRYAESAWHSFYTLNIKELLIKSGKRPGPRKSL